MLKSTVTNAILSLFLVSGGLLSLTLWEGILYSESLALEQDIREGCQSGVCSHPIVFTREHLLNLVIYSSGAAAASAGGIVLLVKRHKSEPSMPDSEAPTILVGLGCGIAFIALIALMLDSYGNQFPTTPSQFLHIASKLPETQEFLSNFASTNTTVYLRDIVEYSFQDAEGKYASLRVSLDRNGGNPSFMQVICVVIGNELDAVEMHGSKLEGITEFLQDERCPETTYLVD